MIGQTSRTREANRDALRRAADAALELAANRRWRDLSLGEVAAAAGLTLTDLYPLAGVDDLVATIEHGFDHALSAGAPEADAPPRERLFDVLMLRFEAMEARRAGVMSLMAHVDASPLRRAQAMRRRAETARWALVSAGLDARTRPLMEPARILGLAWVIRQAERAWLGEESADFSRTMARLDAGLREWEERLDRMADPLRGFTGRRRPEATAPGMAD